MSKIEQIWTALLVVIAVEGAYTAYQIRNIAREGFNVELTMAEADSLATNVQAAKDQALIDWEEEKGDMTEDKFNEIKKEYEANL